MEIVPQPLTQEAFAPYGDVIDIPSEAGRKYYEDALGNLRPAAHPSLSLSLKTETPDRPLKAELLERHEFSSQTFVPIDVDRWLVVVAPHAAAGGPDTKSVRAFIATGKQGVTYKPNTWHHGLTVLDKPGRFAVFMWRTGGQGDEEFVPVEPFTIRIP
jgi:ureidoglycolate lyase